jgi:hypothetical protein
MQGRWRLSVSFVIGASSHLGKLLLGDEVALGEESAVHKVVALDARECPVWLAVSSYRADV